MRVHASSLRDAAQLHCPRVNTLDGSDKRRRLMPLPAPCAVASEMLHPVLQQVSRRGFVIPVCPQLKFAGVGNAIGITSVAANQRALEHRREIRRVLVARANCDGTLARFVNDIQDAAVRSGVVRTDQIPDARDNCRPTLQRYGVDADSIFRFGFRCPSRTFVVGVTLFAKPLRPMHGSCVSSAVSFRGHGTPCLHHYYPSGIDARVPFGTAARPVLLSLGNNGDVRRVARAYEQDRVARSAACHVRQ